MSSRGIPNEVVLVYMCVFVYKFIEMQAPYSSLRIADKEHSNGEVRNSTIGLIILKMCN